MMVRQAFSCFATLAAAINLAQLPKVPYDQTKRFEFHPDSGVSVCGIVDGTYLHKGCDLVELSVEIKNPPAAEPVRIVAPRMTVAKLVSELPDGWSAVRNGEETEIIIPTDRSRRAYPDEAILPRPVDVPDLLTTENGRKITTYESKCNYSSVVA